MKQVYMQLWNSSITILKIGLISLVICMFSLPATAQIEMFNENIKKVEEPKTEPYDSLTNMHIQRFGTKEKYSFTFDHLIGQTLLFCGEPYITYRNEHMLKTGSYYKVTGTLPDNTGKGLYGRMTLVDTITGEKKEEGDLTPRDYNRRWVVLGHYEKMKKLYTNKEFVYLGINDVYIHYDWKKANGLIDLETDTVTKKIPKYSIWKCIGVQVKPRKADDDMYSDKRSPIVLLFDNPKFGKHYCYLENDSGEPYRMLTNETQPYVCGRFQEKFYYDNIRAITATNKAKRKLALTKKYGSANANLILDGKVRIGMTKAMCRESWGVPYDINKSIGSWGTHEQWVYGNSYLYFEENILTAIQN